MKKRILLSAVIALTSAPVVATVINLPGFDLTVVQAQSKELVSLGASLSSQQAQQTLQVLGASHVDAASTVYIDGNTINKYLNDGSNASTQVYSSAYIQPLAEGSGVQVQIVTPQNIQLVSATTYQNAAITAGAKNALIKIGTVTPVTGEGALAGVYALLEQQGLTLKPQDVQVAQKEISLVSEIKDNQTVEISDNQVNQMIADIKQEITSINVNAENSNVTVDNSENNIEITNIVNNITNNYGITDEAMQQLLIKYAQEFAQTEAAQSEDTIDQLETSIQQNWSDVLAGLSGAVPVADLLAAERVDYSDTNVYHPLIQAFANELYRIMEAGEVVDALYSHTFILESLQPNLNSESKKALNDLRTVMYEYAANADAKISSGEFQPGFASIKENWTSKISQFDALKGSDPVMAEIITRLSLATGRSAYVYNYNNVSQEDSVISIESSWDNPTGQQADHTIYTFDLADDSMSEYDVVSNTQVPLANTVDFASLYGTSLENGYQIVEIPADYTVPGYVPAKSSVEEVESTEELPTETSSVVEEVPAQEGTSEEAPAESGTPADEEAADTEIVE